MKRKVHFSEERSNRKFRRSVRKTILEMHAKTLNYRAAEVDYEAWTKTEDYRQEVARFREIVQHSKDDFGENIAFVEP